MDITQTSGPVTKQLALHGIGGSSRLTAYSCVTKCRGGLLHTCCCDGGSRKRPILQLCIVGDGVCAVEIRPVTTCCFVQGIKLEAVRHVLLGVLNLGLGLGLGDSQRNDAGL